MGGDNLCEMPQLRPPEILKVLQIMNGWLTWNASSYHIFQSFTDSIKDEMEDSVTTAAELHIIKRRQSWVGL